MNLNEMKRKYAYTLARVGLNVQKGQTVLVEANIAGYEFIPVFAEECYKLGAGNVVVHYLDLPTMKIHAQYLNLHNVPHADRLQGMPDKPLRHLGDMYQTVLMDADIHKRPEVDDIADRAL